MGSDLNQQQVNEIVNLYNNNNFKDSFEAATNYLTIEPNNIDVLRMHAISAIFLKKLSIAKDSLFKVYKLDPSSTDALNNLANIYINENNLEQAKSLVYQSLKINDANSSSYNILANIYYRQNLLDEAIEYYSKAIRINPKMIESYINIANCFVQKNQLQLAVTNYLKALSSDVAVDKKSLQINIGMCYTELQEYETALLYLEDAITDKSMDIHPNVYGHMGDSYLNLGKNEKAIELYKKAIGHYPEPAWEHNLAVLYLRDEKQDLALNHFKKAYELNPNNKTAEYMINVLSQNNTQYDRADPNYVKELFDQYADYYNNHMKNSLNYNLPIDIRHLVDELTKGQTKLLNTLDLGCGTGLMGIAIRDKALSLVGVDISNRMLLHARSLQGYELLVQADLAEGIPGMNDQFFDLIIAAEICNYFGDLKTLFEDIKSGMNKDSIFIFSIETNENLSNELSNQPNSNEQQNKETSYILNKTGRFIHSTTYIENITTELKFNILSSKKVPLRKDKNNIIYGYLYALQR